MVVSRRVGPLGLPPSIRTGLPVAGSARCFAAVVTTSAGMVPQFSARQWRRQR